MRVVLVRHAEPEVMPDVDPRRWRLSEAGRIAARTLGARLPAHAVLVSGTEPKAYETLTCAAGPDVAVAQHPGFDEVDRNEPFDADYRARRMAWVQGRLDERHAGWETPHETAIRFDQAIALHATAGSPLVVASHGMAITAWLVYERRLLVLRDAGRFWSAMAFPDVIEVG